MMNAAFTNALPLLLDAVLAGLLLVATITDFKRRIIRDPLNLTIALLAPLYWVAMGLTLPEMAIQIGMAIAVFAIFCLFFYLGGMGGGDVKLAAALTLWLALPELVTMILIMSIAGAPITLAAWADHRRSGAEGRVKVPYGIAIALAGWIILAQRYLNHFG